MSVMMQSHHASPSPAINSSADANSRASCPIERSNSTSAVRKESSSSTTEIDSSLDTLILYLEPPPKPEVATIACNRMYRNYTGVLCDLLSPLAIITPCYQPL